LNLHKPAIIEALAMRNQFWARIAIC